VFAGGLKMVRQILLWGLLLAFLGGIVYGYMQYAVIAFYEQDQPKITYLYLVKKPNRGYNFYYNYIDQKEVEKDIQAYERRNIPPPWHMNSAWVVNNSIYNIKLDNRPYDKGSPLTKGKKPLAE
jgi:hypothetical protein